MPDTDDAEELTEKLFDTRAERDLALRRLAKIDERLGRMSDAGRIRDDDYTALCDYVHRPPEEWREPTDAPGR